MHTVEALMQQVNGASFIAINAATDVKLSGGKSNSMQGRVRKIMHGANVMVFQNKNGNNAYQNMVNKRLQDEGFDADSFTVGPRTWGERAVGTPIIEHNGERYLEVIFLKQGSISYELDGAPIVKEDIVGLAKEKQEGHQGGLSRKVILRTFKLSSLTSITINKATYQLQENVHAS